MYLSYLSYPFSTFQGKTYNELSLRSAFMITARLAQSVEHETLNLRVVGSSPTLGDQTFFHYFGISFSTID